MAERIRRHRAARSIDWVTAEEPLDVAEWFRTHGRRYRTVVLDCLTLWLSNMQSARATGARTLANVEALLRAIRATNARVVVVTNEVGLGLVPMNASVRAFRDLAGRINQQVAAEADEVYFVVSGQRLRIK
jgi:adenosylcobinamide kinase/adenosylcobinamide-phosphate guanylyltransferase